VAVVADDVVGEGPVGEGVDEHAAINSVKIMATRCEAVRELEPEDKNDVAVSDRPSWPQEGWLRHKENGSQYLIGAAGVVVQPTD
jgi:hypothetical protein